MRRERNEKQKLLTGISQDTWKNVKKQDGISNTSHYCSWKLHPNTTFTDMLLGYLGHYINSNFCANHRSLIFDRLYDFWNRRREQKNSQHCILAGSL
jgi:hypothetical protein